MRRFFEEVKLQLEQGRNLVLVTIIAGHGSSPRRAGARMLVREDGTTFGTIGGGAVEYQSGRLAMDVLKNKQSYIKGFSLSQDQVAGLGMICGGSVTVYFQYADSGSTQFKCLCDTVLDAVSRDENSWLITDITDETAWNMGLYRESGEMTGLDEKLADYRDVLCTAKPVMVTAEDHIYYSEPLVRAGRVYIFGGGHVSQELVPVLAHLDFSCVVCDDREEFANSGVFPLASHIILGKFEDIFEHITITKQDYIVIMTRGHQYDYLIQRQALHTPACYIGAIGSRSKIKIVSGKLKADGFTDKDLERFSTPIGLDIAAETPAEIAISIAGELIRKRALGF